MGDLLAGLKGGGRGAVAKAISAAEDGAPEAAKLLRAVFTPERRSPVIGITGPAGAGKSTLINGVAQHLAGKGHKPAVIAVDPTSELTGGAILGDRVRMSELTDAGVYVRSMASRGATGAVSRTLRDCIRILEYAGFSPIILESVGAGQTETAIAQVADATVVVFNPQTGDSIQAIKAGLTEVGNMYVVNKSDLAGASQLHDAVRDYIGTGSKRPAVLKASAKRGTGVPKVASTAMDIAEARAKDADLARKRLESELRDIVLNNINDAALAMLKNSAAYKRQLDRLQKGATDPYRAGRAVSQGMLK